MMMKFLPFVAAAAAERRFLTKGAAKIDATNQNLMFDTAVNKADASAIATGAFAIDKGAIFIGAKLAANRPGGLLDGTAYKLGLPTAFAATNTANWKANSRKVTVAAGTTASMTDAEMPDCNNMFIESSNAAAGAATKEGAHIQPASFSGAASAALTVTFASATNAGLANDDYVYLACKAGGKQHKSLTCGTTYQLKNSATAESFVLQKSAANDVKGQADHTTGVTVGDMYFVETGATSKTLSVCTAKASASRMAAFVSGLIAYALLM